MKVLFNPSKGADIVDYPISEAQKDSNGIPVWDSNTGNYRTTGRTLEFSLRKGQAAEFEDYVADLLLERCSFLINKGSNPSKAVKETMLPQEETAHEAGPVKCQYCGQSFRGALQLGTHLGAKHPEKIT